MKKFYGIIITVLCCALLAFTACGRDGGSNGGGGGNGSTDGQDVTFTFYVPDGAPALAIAKFIAEGDDLGLGHSVDYNVVSSNDISMYLNGAKGYGDFVILPVNAASKLYKANAEDPYKMAAVITHGNLFIMSASENLTAEGLKGQVVGVIGEGLVPDLTLRAALSKAGLSDCIETGDSAAADKITLNYFQQASDMMPLLLSGKLSYGLLPEPAATTLETKAAAQGKTFYRLSLQDMYDAESREYSQAVLMVKSSVAEEYQGVMSALGDKFTAAAEWAAANSAEAVNAVNKNITDKEAGFTPSLQPSAVTAEVIRGCNIRWQGAADAKDDVKAYLADIINVGVGLDIPPAVQVGDDFFLTVSAA